MLPCEQTCEKAETLQRDRTYSSPDNHSAWHLPFDTIGALKKDTLLVHLLYHRLREDINVGLLERSLGVRDQLLAE